MQNILPQHADMDKVRHISAHLLALWKCALSLHALCMMLKRPQANAQAKDLHVITTSPFHIFLVPMHTYLLHLVLTLTHFSYKDMPAANCHALCYPPWRLWPKLSAPASSKAASTSPIQSSCLGATRFDGRCFLEYERPALMSSIKLA